MAEVGTDSPYYMSTERRSLIATTLSGLAVGIVGWLLSIGLQRFFIEPVFCRNADAFATCAQGGTVAWIVALVIASAVGLVVLVRTSVFRPLLVVLAAIITLWGVSTWLGPLVWWQALLWHGLLFALAYALYGWLARAEKFPVAFISTVVVILALRLVATNV